MVNPYTQPQHNDDGNPPGASTRRHEWIIGIVLIAVFFVIASRLTVSWSERFYLIVPWIYALQTVAVVRRRGWRSSLRRVLVCVVTALALGVFALWDWQAPNADYPPMERSIRFYGLIAVIVVSSWIWAWTGEPIRKALAADASPLSRRIPGRAAAIFVFVFVLYPYLFAFIQTHYPKHLGRQTPRLLQARFDDITWHSYDGTRIVGWFVYADNSDRTAIVCHGVGADKSDVLGLVAAAHEGGYNVLAFDFRGHGASGGHTVSYGKRELWDIRSGIDMMRDRYPQQCRRIVGVGWSMGAASLIFAAAADERIEALHVDAAYARTFDIAKVLAKRTPPVFRTAGLYLGTAIASVDCGANLFTLAPMDVVGKISPRPIMIVHGDRDELIPSEQGQKIFEAAGPPKSWHVVKGAGHCRAIDSPEYAPRMIAFLDDALDRPR